MSTTAVPDTVILGGGQRVPTIALCSTFLAIAWVTVLLRVYTRVIIMKIFYSEDWIMVLTAMIFTVYCAMVVVQEKIIAVGAHTALTESQVVAGSRCALVIESFYTLGVLFLKTSIGLFFLRLAVRRLHRVVISFAIALSGTFSLALCLFVIFQCGYFTSIEDYVQKKANGQCVNPDSLKGMFYAHGAVTALTDWIFVVVPFFILQDSQMKTKDKMAVGSLMAFASISGITALVRFKFMPGVAVTQPTFFTTIANLAIWSGAEVGIGIAAGCLCCLRPLLRTYGEKFARSLGRMIDSSYTDMGHGHTHRLHTISTNSRDYAAFAREQAVYTKPGADNVSAIEYQTSVAQCTGPLTPKLLHARSNEDRLAMHYQQLHKISTTSPTTFHPSTNSQKFTHQRH